MEKKINREIRDYKENVYFGLSLRQFVFSACACAAAAGVYYVLRQQVGKEVLSWLCMAAAVPFVLLGFVRYNGMPAEKVLIVWFRSELGLHRPLGFYTENLYTVWLRKEIKIEQENEKKKGKEKKKHTTDREEIKEEETDV